MAYVHVSNKTAATYMLGPSGIVFPTIAEPPKPDESEALPPDQQFGKHLFSRGRMMGGWWTLLVLAIVLIVGCAAAVIASGGSGWAWWILLNSTLLLILPVYQIKKGPCHVRFYERGVAQTVGKRESRIPYDRIAALTYQITRTYVNGSYSATNLKLTITPDETWALQASEPRPRPIVVGTRHAERAVKRGFFKREIIGGDQLDAMHNALAEGVARKIVEQIIAGNRVPWGKKLHISHQGIHRGTLALTYAGISGAYINEGVLQVFGPDVKSFCTINAGEVNHLPGLLALDMMLKRHGNPLGGGTGI